MFKYLAGRADQNVLTTELAAGVGRTPCQMAGAFTFGRRFAKCSGKDGEKWSFAAFWDYERNMMTYRLSPAAEVIAKLSSRHRMQGPSLEGASALAIPRHRG